MVVHCGLRWVTGGQGGQVEQNRERLLELGGMKYTEDECDEVIHLIPEKTVHQRIPLKPAQQAQAQASAPAPAPVPHSSYGAPGYQTFANSFLQGGVGVPNLPAQPNAPQDLGVFLPHSNQVQPAAHHSPPIQREFQQQLENTIHEQRSVLEQMQIPSYSVYHDRYSAYAQPEPQKIAASTIPVNNKQGIQEISAPPGSIAPYDKCPIASLTTLTVSPDPAAEGSKNAPYAVAAGITGINETKVPEDALAKLKETQSTIVKGRNPPLIPQSSHFCQESRASIPADTSTLRDKFVQRGAASFVAQLRATQDNEADMLVSLILTKEMLLVAKKPSYKTLYTLKFASGLKAFPVPRDPNGVIAHLLQETLEAFVKLGGFSGPAARLPGGSEREHEHPSTDLFAGPSAQGPAPPQQ
eukprot:768104-Hanusia_phi.AAC.1